MIETTVLNFLSGKLRVPVLAEVPEKPPGSFAVVEKDRRRTQHRPEAGHCGRAELRRDAFAGGPAG